MNNALKSKAIGILFSDTKGYSKFTEPQLRSYLSEVLKEVSEILNEHEAQYPNTWGDGLVSFFENPAAMARCALSLRDYYLKKNWSDNGFPSDVSIRIALHFAHIYFGTNYITGNSDFVGSQVNLAARIEPIVAPGHVYCTKQFVTQLSTSEDSKISADKIGELELAKGWGKEEIYRIRWNFEPDTLPQVLDEKVIFQEIASNKDPVIKSIEILNLDGLPDFIIGNTIVNLGKSQDARALKPLGDILLDSEKYSARQRAAAAAALGDLSDNRSLTYLKQAALDELDMVSITSMKAIHGLKDNRATSVLREICEDKENKSTNCREMALKVLIELNDNQSVDTFLSCIDNEPINISVSAIRGLGKIGNQRALEKLREIAGSSDVPGELRLQSIISIGEAKDRKAIDMLLKILDEDWDKAKAAAIIALASIGDYKAVPKLMSLYADKENQADYIRWGILEKLFKYQDERVVAFLLEALEEENEDIKLKAIESLKELKPKNAVSKLIVLAENENETIQVRKESIEALEMIGYAEAVPSLLNLLKSSEEDIIIYAIAALHEIPSHISKIPLVEVASNRESYSGRVREASLKALIKIADDTILDNIIQLTEDTYEPVAAMAVHLLGKVGGKSAIDRLNQVLINRKEYSFKTIQLCIIALAELKHNECEKQIIEILENENEIEEVKTAAIYYLGQIGTQNSIDTLKLYAMQESRLGGSAREALFKLTSIDR